MTKEIKHMEAEYNALLEKSKVPVGVQRTKEQAEAFVQKGVLMGKIRAAQREFNSKGKRSLQEEYVRKFDGEKPVQLPDAKGEVRETTLQQHHKERLLK